MLLALIIQIKNMQVLHFRKHINFKTYDFVQIYFELKDENKLIKSINGAKKLIVI